MILLKKKGQISIEIMYSVAVLLVIFLVLSSATFDRKIQVERTRDTVNKRSDCIMISNALSRAASLGEGYSTTFKTVHNFDIFDTGLIVVGDLGDKGPKEVEVVCSYNGLLNQTAYKDYLGSWRVNNTEGMLQLSPT